MSKNMSIISPNGRINLELFQKFRDGADIFIIVSAATFRYTRDL